MLILERECFFELVLSSRKVNFVLSCGITAEQINAFRAAMIDGTPETLSPTVSNYTVSRALVEVFLTIIGEAQRGGAIGHLPYAGSHVGGIEGERGALIVVAHGHLDVFHRELLVGDYPQRHILGVFILAESPGQVTVEAADEMVEESPHARVAEAAALEVGFGVGHLPREVGILAGEPALRAGEGNDVFSVSDVLLILHVELSDAALVGVGADGVVGIYSL